MFLQQLMIPCQQTTEINIPILKDSFTMDQLFDCNFKIPADFKSQLEIDLYNKYKRRGLCCDDPDQFLDYFQSKLILIMGKYNELYLSTKLEYEPLVNYSMKETYDESTTDKNTGSSTRKNSNTSKDETETSDTLKHTVNNALSNFSSLKNADTSAYSDTPQGSIKNIDSYLTNATKNAGETTKHDVNTETNTVKDDNTHVITRAGESTGSDTTNTSNDGSGTKSYTITRAGNLGTVSGSQLLDMYRETIININQMIIDDMADCFYQLW